AALPRASAHATRQCSDDVIQILNATTTGEIDAAFATFERERPDALFVAGDAFFVSRAVQFATLAARDRIPASYALRDYVAAGGLMSYATDFTDSFRQVGVYTGSILKGAKPADLPVLQSTKFEFVINLQIARSLGIAVPAGLLAIADEVVEGTAATSSRCSAARQPRGRLRRARSSTRPTRRGRAHDTPPARVGTRFANAVTPAQIASTDLRYVPFEVNALSRRLTSPRMPCALKTRPNLDHRRLGSWFLSPPQICGLHAVVGQELRRAAAGRDPAGLDHVAAVGDRERGAGVLLDQEYRQPGLLESPHDLENLLDQHGGKAHRGLIE